jgi:hypothetical protein
MKIDFKILNNFEELRRDFEDEQFKQTPEERLADVEFCRRQYCLMKGIDCSEPLKRVIEILPNRLAAEQEESPKKTRRGGLTL